MVYDCTGKNYMWTTHILKQTKYHGYTTILSIVMLDNVHELFRRVEERAIKTGINVD